MSPTARRITARRMVASVGLFIVAVVLTGCGSTAAASTAPAAAPTAAPPPAAPAGAHAVVPAGARAVVPAGARAVVPAVSATPCVVTAKACMDLSTRQAWLTDGAGHVTYGPVAARGGKKGAQTPVGTFRVLSKDKNFYSTEFDAPMPYSVFFYPGDAFHADSPTVASNGCIHLNYTSAQQFYNTLRTGDQVETVS